MDSLDSRVARIEEARPRGLHFIGANELLREIKPPDFLVGGWIEKNTINQMVGKSNAGKSLIALDWALCIATGTLWNGVSVEQAPVIYICGEGHNGVRRRLKAWEIERGISLEGAPFAMSSQAVRLRDPDAAGEVLAAIETGFERKPGLIVIDTLARNFGGNENSTEDMAAFVDNVDDCIRRPFEAAVLIVHHTGKADHETGRGSTVLIGALDNSFKVTQMTDGLVTLSAIKIRDGEKPDDLVQEIKAIELDGYDKFGNPFTAPVLMQSERSPVAQSPLGGNQRKAIAILEQLTKSYGVDTEPDEPVWIPLKSYREKFFDEILDRKRFGEVNKSLIDRGLLVMNEHHVRLKGDLE